MRLLWAWAHLLPGSDYRLFATCASWRSGPTQDAARTADADASADGAEQNGCIRGHQPRLLHKREELVCRIRRPSYGIFSSGTCYLADRTLASWLDGTRWWRWLARQPEEARRSHHQRESSSPPRGGE